ncbi:MAG: adenylate/guanylate cyclase domain-containing protein [Bryobacteraceae bacterium]
MIAWGMSIRWKIVAMLLLVGLGAIAVIGYLGDRTGKDAIRQRVSSQFMALLAAKTFQVQTYFDQIQRQVQDFSEDPTTIEAMRSMNRAYHELNRQKIPVEWKTKLRHYYADEFVPALEAIGGEHVQVDAEMPSTPAAQYLQYFYIASHGPDHRRQLTDAKDGSEYSKLHARYHPLFAEYIKKFGFHDIMLVDTDSGDVIYTHLKEPDFGSNVASGPFKTTNFSRAVQASREGTFSDYLKLVDFESYAPSEGMPAGFIASPIFDGPRHIGDLVFQMSIAEIDRIMTDDRQWRQSGMGETGESFIVGPQYFMRSNARMLLENPREYLRELEKAGVPRRTIDVIDRAHTSILQVEVKNAAVEAALRGETGSTIVKNTRGQRTICYYTPLRIHDLHWVLLSQIEVAEAAAPVAVFQRQLLLWSGWIVLLIVAIALLLARSFVKPLEALMEGTRRFSRGELDVNVDVHSHDEFGKLATTFNAMVENISDKTRVIQQKNEENERLLLNMLPRVIADRLKLGEQNISDGFAEATVLFADIVGFTKFSATVSPQKLVIFLNDLFRRFDEAAQRLHIEKIKTIGDCYMAATNLPTPRVQHIRAMVEMGLEMLRLLDDFNHQHGTELEVRIGINTGPVVAGVIGSIKYIYDLWGDTVNVASRMESTGVPGAIQVTESIYDALKAEYEFEPRGPIEVKGKGEMAVYLLRGKSALVSSGATVAS